jgi:tetratricopeptide (TPR) repeat protein
MLKRSFHAVALVLLLAGCDQLSVSADPQAQVEQAYAALERKQYGEAIALFESSLRQRPDATVFALLGDCYWSQWKHGNHDPRLLERANVEYRKGLALDGNHCGLNHATGRDLVLLKRPAEALPYLDAAKTRCARQSLEAQNLWFRIQALVALRRVDEAQIEFAGMSERFALHPMTDLAGQLLADTTQDVALRAKYRGKAEAVKK